MREIDAILSALERIKNGSNFRDEAEQIFNNLRHIEQKIQHDKTVLRRQALRLKIRTEDHETAEANLMAEQAALKHTQDNLSNRTRILDKYEAELNLLKEQLQSQNKQLTAAQSEIDSREINIQEKMAQIRTTELALSAQFSSIEKERKELGDQTKQLENNLDELSVERNADRVAFEEEVNDLKQQLYTKQQEIIILTAEVTELRRHVEYLQKPPSPITKPEGEYLTFLFNSSPPPETQIISTVHKQPPPSPKKFWCCCLPYFKIPKINGHRTEQDPSSRDRLLSQPCSDVRYLNT